MRSVCFPISMYGLSAVSLTMKDIKNFSFAYNSIFVKMFKTSNSTNLEQCQFYFNMLPFRYLYDLSRFNFLVNSAQINCKPTSNCIMVREFCQSDFELLKLLCVRYNLNLNDSKRTVYAKLWKHFSESLDQ